MMNSDLRLLVVGCALASMAGAMDARADVVTLTSGAERLTGILRSIGDDGVMELQSDLSAEPLKLRGAMVEKVEFAVSGEEPVLPTARVELVNGDVIPCAVREMDGSGLMVDSPVLGSLRVERRHLAAIQFGVHSRKAVYAGPRDGGDWKRADESDSSWNYVNGDLVAMGPAFASRQIGFPERFDLGLELEWTKNAVPSLQVFFCDPLVGVGERCDRYYLQFGSAGLEIKRESATGRRYTTIGFVNRMPGQCVDRKLRIELQVDRRDSSLRLMLDGKPEGEFRDPVGAVPAGAGMTLVSQASDGMQQRVREIEVRESDVAPLRHRAERQLVMDRESVITRKDERWTGELLEIKAAGVGRVLSFKSDFGEKPLELPEADVSTVFFPQRGEVAPLSAEVLYLLRHTGGGILRIASCRFEADAATMDHPLLGSLKLERGELRSIERTVPGSVKPTGE